MPDPETNTDRRSGTLERHIQTVLISVVVGVLAFAGNYFFSDKADKAVLVAQLSALTQQVAEMRGEVRSMASKETTADHEARIRANESQIADLRRAFAERIPR
jgi:outer membrane murein-binding lipoprotein Lpp